ncbi:MAG: TMEM198/TM7SF3 family protein, partial [Lachnospiraceae bacterium]|nr:TMEM198/TM7SF3 family protein [Lachnospiraceae bacterium]
FGGNYNLKDLGIDVSNIEGANKIIKQISNFSVALLIAAIIVGIIIGIFGFKLIRVLGFFSGFTVGVILGYLGSTFAGPDLFTTVIIAGVVGAIIGVLATVFKRFGAFIIGILFLSLASFALCDGNIIVLIVLLALSLIISILALFFVAPMTIFSTSIFGGTLAAFASYVVLKYFIGIDGLNEIMVYIVAAVLFIVGIIIQSLMHSKKIKKNNARKAKEIKSKSSRESEVEKAKALLDDDFVSYNEDEAEKYQTKSMDEDVVVNKKKNTKKDKNTKPEIDKDLNFIDLDDDDEISDEELDAHEDEILDGNLTTDYEDDKIESDYQADDVEEKSDDEFWLDEDEDSVISNEEDANKLEDTK